MHTYRFTNSHLHSRNFVILTQLKASCPDVANLFDLFGVTGIVSLMLNFLTIGRGAFKVLHLASIPVHKT